MNISSTVSRFRSAALAACLLLPVLASAAPPVAGPNVNMVSGTKFPEGDPFATKQNEPSIAVSSRNPRHLLAASNDYRQVAVQTAEGLKGGKAWNTMYKSVDGGTSWRSVVLGGCPLNIPACNDATGLTAPLKALAPDFSADPTVRSGPHGTFFYSFIAGRRDGSAQGVVGIQRFVDKNNNIQRDTDVRKINGQDVIKWAEDPIVPDKLNIIDVGTTGQFIDKPWNAADVGGRSWNAGKTCELLSWTNNSSVVTPAAETVPAFNVYVSYALFAGGGNNEHPTVYVAASQDCGTTFAKPVKVSNGLDANSGTSLVIDPQTGHVYVFWRRFGSIESPVKPDQIIMNKSTDGGKTWLNQAVVVANFVPYDQGTTGGSFRTLAFPSAAVSVASTGQSRIHVAFTARGAPAGATAPYACQAEDPKLCDSRMKLATSLDGGLTWQTPVDVDPIPAAPPANPAGRGHQFQPALTFAAGKLFITWLDQRYDQTEEVLTCPSSGPCTADNLVRNRVAMGNLDPNCRVDVGSAPLSSLTQAQKDLLGPDPGACYEYRSGRPASVWTTYLTDGSPGLVRRHTVDLFGAMADPADVPSFSSSRISQYLFGSSAADSEGKYVIRQKEVFAPNLPLYINGGAAFIGDYIDSAAQNIVATGDPDPAVSGKFRYKFNTGGATSAHTVGGLSPVFHVAHTDNRDVIPPASGDWTAQTCLAASFTGDPSKPTTNFGNCSTPGYAGNRNQNVYSTIVTDGSVAYANANAKALSAAKPRGFVVTVDNLDSDPAGRTYQFSIVAPSGVSASFDKDSFATTSPTAVLGAVTVQVQPRSSATRTVWVQAGATNARVVVQITSPAGCSSSSCTFSTEVALNADPGATSSLVGTGDGPGIDDIANNDLGNVVLSNAVLTNNVLSNNALSNAALSNNALTNAALSNVVLSNAVLSNLQLENLSLGNVALTNNALTNAVLSNVVLTNAVLTNVVLTNSELGNVVLSNNVLSNATPEAAALSNAVLSNNALTNVALTNVDPANVALSNAVLSNNVLSNVALTNNVLSNVMLSNAALTNAALTNVALSNAALSNNALSNNALSNNALSNNALSNAPESDDLRTVEAANFDLGKNAFTSDDLAVSDFLDASFTVRNRGNTDTTLAVKLLLRDADCTGGSCSLPPGVKLQLVMRKITLTPAPIAPTGPAVTTGRALRLGLVQSNAQVSNVGTPEVIDPAALDLGKFQPSKTDAATLPLSPGERAYVTLRAVGATAGFDLVEFLRWGAKFVVVDAANDTRTLIPLIIKTMTLPSVTAAQPASLPLKTAGGFGAVTGTAVCADRFGAPSGDPAFEAGTGCLPPVTATFTNDSSGNGTLAFTPAVAGTFYLLVTVNDSSIPQQDDRQLLKVVVNLAAPSVTSLVGNPNFPAQIPMGQPFDLSVLLGPAPLLSSDSPEPITFATDPSAAGVCTVSGTTLTPVGVGACTFLVQQGATLTYASVNITSPPVPIVAGTQTVTLAAALPGSLVWGTSYALPAATSSSGNTVTFTGTGACSVSAGAISYNGTVGACQIAANVAGNTNWNPVTNASIGSIAITPAPQTVTLVSPTPSPLPASLAYAASIIVAATSTSGGTVSLTGSGACSVVSGTLAMNLASGTCSINAHVDATGPYQAYDGVVGTIAATQGSLILTWSISSTTSVFGDALTCTLTGASGPSGCTSGVIVPSPITCTGLPSTSPVPVGTSYTVGASANVTSSLCAITYSPASLSPFAVAKATPVFAGTTATAAYPSLQATLSGKLNRPDKPSIYPADSNAVTVAVVKDGVPQPSVQATPGGTDGSFSVQTAVTAGSYALTFMYGGNANFNAAADASATLGVEGFTLAGNMVQARSFHTSTLLADGRVLVAGGFDASGGTTATSEVYCTSAVANCTAIDVGKFKAVGNLPSKSAAHTATRLLNNKVLVVGGGNSSAQMFDPVANTWSPSGGLSSNRSYHTATLITSGPNAGKVLIAGGADNSGKSVQSTIVYNPANGGSFGNGPSLTTARERHTATLLTTGPDAGKVLIAGGRQKSGNGYVPLDSFEICDLAGTCVGYTAKMTAKRFSHTATALALPAPNGVVLVTGGSNATSASAASALATADVYVPATRTWSALNLADTTVGRRDHAAALLADGRILVTGGFNATTSRLASTEFYTGSFITGPGMGAARSGHAATVLGSGRVLVTGGVGASGSSIGSAELFVPQ